MLLCFQKVVLHNISSFWYSIECTYQIIKNNKLSYLVSLITFSCKFYTKPPPATNFLMYHVCFLQPCGIKITRKKSLNVRSDSCIVHSLFLLLCHPSKRDKDASNKDVVTNNNFVITFHRGWKHSTIKYLYRNAKRQRSIN